MKIVKLKDNKKAISEALKVIKNGGLVVFPSDTVYGLLADATCEAAVKKLIAFKNRPPGKAISVFTSDFKMMRDIVKVNNRQQQLLHQLLPGCFTVVLKSKHKVSRLLESEKGTLGVRIPDYKLIYELVSKFDKPITATSANIGGKPPHYKISTLLNELPDKKKQIIDLVVDGGDLARNKPSTVVDLTQPKIKILRQGDIVFSGEKTFISKSPEQTKKIAQHVARKLLTDIKTPLVLIIKGELGVGKTIFVKGLGEYFGINNIISPSFVVCYEYEIQNNIFKKLIHFDLYNIEEKDEFKYLGIETYLQKGNLLVFEWGEKAGEIFNLLKSKAKIIYVKMEYVNENSRSIGIKSKIQSSNVKSNPNT